MEQENISKEVHSQRGVKIEEYSVKSMVTLEIYINNYQIAMNNKTF